MTTVQSNKQHACIADKLRSSLTSLHYNKPSHLYEQLPIHNVSGSVPTIAINYRIKYLLIRGLFVKFVDWQHCADVMQREAVTVMRSCSGEGDIVGA
jgi:hypothetical protein